MKLDEHHFYGTKYTEAVDLIMVIYIHISLSFIF